MAGLNKVQLIGRLGRDPEVRTFQNGGKIVSLRVACSESWKDRNSGERKERTEWISVSIQNEGLAGVAEKYLRKGSKVYIEGKIETRKWQDQQGNDRYSTEVVLRPYHGELVLLDGRQDGQGGNRDDRGEDRGNDRRDGGSSSSSGGGSRSGGGYGGGRSDLDDDIPFAPEWRG